MNITFLIGNGFDIGAGIKSKFLDFFPIYQEKSRNKPSHIRQLSEQIGSDYETWADFEIALGKYTLQFNNDTKQNLIDQIEDFTDEFLIYLDEQQQTLCFDRTEHISEEMIRAITYFCSKYTLENLSEKALSALFTARQKQNHIYNFINFNYTSILDNCLAAIPNGEIAKRKVDGKEYVDTIGDIIHIHGYRGAFPIIGVNDAEQILNKDLANDKSFLKYMVKPTINEYLRNGNNESASALIEKSTIICIYGMSLGATDKKWWAHLLRWLYNDSARQLIIFDYDGSFSSSTPVKRLRKEDFLISKFAEYNTSSAVNVEALRTRIHLVINKRIFSIELVDKITATNAILFPLSKKEASDEVV